MLNNNSNYCENSNDIELFNENVLYFSLQNFKKVKGKLVFIYLIR